MIRSYAAAQIAAEDAIASGRPVPQEVVNTLQVIEARAQQTLNPHQQRSAMQHVAAAKQAIRQEQHARYEVDYTAWARHELETVNRRARNLTQNVVEGGMTGAELINTVQRKPSTRRVGLDRAKRDAELRAVTKRDLGREMGFDAFAKEMNYITDIGNKADALETARKKFPNADPARLESYLEEWDRDGIAIQLNDRRTADAHDETYEPSDADSRKAEIALNAYTDEPELRDVLDDAIGDDYLTDDGRRGDVARAMALHTGDD
jgi:hypothetical protein